MSKQITKQILSDMKTMSALDFLRRDEGDSVTILCDNPEADDSHSQTGVEVSGDWNGWEEQRFLARTWMEAVLLAARARREYEEGLK